MLQRAGFLVTGLLSVLASPSEAQERAVYHINVAGPVEVELADLIEETLRQAQGDSTAVVVLDVSSSGGRMDIAQLIVGDLITTPVPVYALVTDRAWHAAALIALAADSIFVVADATIGAGLVAATDGQPMPRAALQAIRNDFGSLVERHGMDASVGHAMVDEGVQVRGLSERGKLLTFSADAAVESGLAAGHVVDLDDMLTVLAIAQPVVRTLGEARSDGVTLEIVNYNLNNARLLLMRGGSRYRLGVVPTNGSNTFDVEQSLVPVGARIRLVAELIGGSARDRVETEEILVRPGLVIQWTIETRLVQSNLFYFVRP